MTPVDVKIVCRLIEGAPRSTTSELARHVGMSAPAVRERIRRLEEAEIIRGYETRIDPRALGYNIAVFCESEAVPGCLQGA